jgi:hypothetical protein
VIDIQKILEHVNLSLSGHRLVEIMGIYNKTNAVDNAANLSKIFDGK